MNLENVKQEHIEDLVKIIYNTWNFEKFGIKQLENLKFSFLDLCDCLSRSNYSKVAIVDGKPVGFLLGRDFRKPVNSKWDYLKEEVKKVRDDLKGSENYQLLKETSELYEAINPKLKEELDINFDSELILFAVDKEYKRKGIGSALLSDFESYLLNNDLHNLHVFTDTTCNYQFYDKNGFVRRNTISKAPKIRKGEVVDFYIYSKTLEDLEK